MPGVASFHLVRAHRAVAAMAHLATDRRHLRRVEGLDVWRLLGTGRGMDTGPSADLRRTAMFAVWRDEADLDAFLARSPVAEAWSAAEESWHVRLRAIGGHGSWRGADVLGGLARGVDDGPIAVLTRADVRVARLAGVPLRQSGRQRRAVGRPRACWRRPGSASSRSAGWARSACGPAWTP